jgi:hypothetical protein
MESWQHATDSDRQLYKAISIVFLNHPNLLEFLFEGEQPRIRLRGLEMRRAAICFSSGEQLLLRVALDMWSGSGNAKIWQLLETLDAGNFANVLNALVYLRGLQRDN